MCDPLPILIPKMTERNADQTESELTAEHIDLRQMEDDPSNYGGCELLDDA